MWICDKERKHGQSQTSVGYQLAVGNRFRSRDTDERET